MMSSEELKLESVYVPELRARIRLRNKSLSDYIYRYIINYPNYYHSLIKYVSKKDRESLARKVINKKS